MLQSLVYPAQPSSFPILYASLPSEPQPPQTIQSLTHVYSSSPNTARSPDEAASSWFPSLGDACFQLKLWSHTDAFLITLVFLLEVKHFQLTLRRKASPAEGWRGACAQGKGAGSLETASTDPWAGCNRGFLPLG